MRIENRVRQRREARGLSQAELAERVGLSRQSVGAIETKRAVPAVDVALRLAHELSCRVEELFGAPAREASIRAEGSAELSDRVALARIDERWVCRPLRRDAARTAADGIVVSTRGRSPWIEPVRPLRDASENVLLLGCAGGLGLLAERLNLAREPGRFLWFSCSSTSALEALAKREAHVAGVHLVDARTGEANVADIRRLGFAEPVTLITLARWEEGLVVRPSDGKRIRQASDLGRPGLRLVGREPGAGAQRLLERELSALGLPLGLARKPAVSAGSHFDVARAVAMGVADTGVATRDAALAFELGFIPLAEERYDLAIPRSSLGDARVGRMLDALVSRGFKRELAAVGYDIEPAGERVAEVA